MIASQESPRADHIDVWAQLAAPLPTGVIAWRQDGKPISRDGSIVARFVAYIEANTVRERLDTVVPGEWDLTLELLPSLPLATDDGDGANCSFKARLQVLGVTREDVGTGRDYKQAATDAFKRAAVRFGIGHELYAYEPNWVAVDSEGKHAKPLEDPQVAYVRRYPRSAGANAEGAVRSRARRPGTSRTVSAMYEARVAAPASSEGTFSSAGPATQSPSAPTLTSAGPNDEESPLCPKCGGQMWDNRLTKRNPKAPDYKCRDRGCDGVIWPARPAAVSFGGGAASEGNVTAPLPLADEELPF